ncbi:MAG TPA: hypothetical protein VHQ43_00970 [Solirubrobacterales bacterium]|jgi:hypothetical protein|nr:hypothetical protein [Solirubrobacterales bacterium]
MPIAETTSRPYPLSPRALDNKEVQEQIRRGADRLRSAYGRSRKRWVKAARDAKLRRQVAEGTRAFALAAKAFAGQPRKPKRRWGRRLLVFLTLGVVGGGVALALKNRTEGGLQ